MRRLVAAIVGLFMAAGAGLGDAAFAVALSDGEPRGAFPLCTPDGPVDPGDPGGAPERLGFSGHCDFCALGGGAAPLAAYPAESAALRFFAAAVDGLVPQALPAGRRAELYPQSRRGPPLRS